jgi:hypothetical protein
MRILAVGFHTTYQYELAQLGDEYQFEYVLSLWDHRNRPLPPNVRLVEHEDTLTRYDVILAHGVQDFIHWQERLTRSGWDVPITMSFHTYPPHWDECRSGLPVPFHQLPDLLREVPKVFVTAGARKLWGFADEPNTAIIPHAVDCTRWHGYQGEREHILTVCNRMWEQDRYRGGSLFDLATDGLPTRVIGDNPGRSRSARCAEELQDAYRRARVFLWTGHWGPRSFAPLEAMATGLPLVTISTPDWAELIEDGVNGFVCSEPLTMRRRCAQLLEDIELARVIGARGRETVRRRFGQQQFQRRWRQVFAAALEGTSIVAAGEAGYGSPA